MLVGRCYDLAETPPYGPWAEALARAPQGDGFPAPPEGGLPEAWSLFWIGAWLEMVGGALLLVGLFTRPVAFVLSGEMAVAYWMFHAPASAYPVLNGGDAAILFTFVFLLLVFTGPGALSLDGALRNGPSAA